MDAAEQEVDVQLERIARHRNQLEAAQAKARRLQAGIQAKAAALAQQSRKYHCEMSELQQQQYQEEELGSMRRQIIELEEQLSAAAAAEAAREMAAREHADALAAAQHAAEKVRVELQESQAESQAALAEALAREAAAREEVAAARRQAEAATAEAEAVRREAEAVRQELPLQAAAAVSMLRTELESEEARRVVPDIRQHPAAKLAVEVLAHPFKPVDAIAVTLSEGGTLFVAEIIGTGAFGCVQQGVFYPDGSPRAQFMSLLSLVLANEHARHARDFNSAEARDEEAIFAALGALATQGAAGGGFEFGTPVAIKQLNSQAAPVSLSITQTDT